MVASNRNISNPDAASVGHQHGGIVGAHVQHNLVILLSRGLRSFRSATETKHIVREEIVEGQRCHLYEFNFAARLSEGFHGVVNQFAFHGKQAHLGLQHETAFLHTTTHGLIIPDHIVQVEGDLLPRFVADNLSHLAAFHRWQLDKLGQRTLARNTDRNQIPVDLVPLKKRFHRLANQFFRDRVGLTENFRVSDVIKGYRKDLLAVL